MWGDARDMGEVEVPAGPHFVRVGDSEEEVEPKGCMLVALLVVLNKESTTLPAYSSYLDVVDRGDVEMVVVES